MTHDDFLAAFRGGVQLTADLPVTGPVVRRVYERISSGETALWKALEPAWLRRHFATPRDAWLLLLNGFHYEALRRPDHALTRFFPTTRGKPGPELAAAVDRQLDAPSEDLVRQLLERSRAVYLDFWSGLWLNPASYFFGRMRLPYIVAEAGTIGGLHAAADLLSPQPGFDSKQVIARVGFDVQPLDFESPADRAWLLGGVFPENTQHFASVQAAVAKYRSLRKDDAPPVQLVPCEPSLSARAISKNVRPEPDLGLLVLTTWATQRMTPEEFAAFRTDMAALMAEWGGRALWLELAAAPDGRPTIDYRFAGHRLREGRLVSQVLARIEMGAAQPLTFDEAANQAFLA